MSAANCSAKFGEFYVSNWKITGGRSAESEGGNQGPKVFVEGPKGKLDFELPRRTSAKLEGGNVIVSREGEDAEAKALHGLSRALVNNMVKGVSEGFVKKLEIQGVGFKAAVQGKNVNLALGYSHPINYPDSRPDQSDGGGKHQADHRRAEQTVGRPGRGGNPQLLPAGALQRQGVRYVGEKVGARKARQSNNQPRCRGQIRGPPSMRTDKKIKTGEAAPLAHSQKITGTKERPRMSVRFSNENIYVQFIDDAAGVTLASASTLGKTAPDRAKLAANAAGAKRSAPWRRKRPRAKASPASCLIAAARVITAKSRRWRMPRAKAD